jgi:hypothetical protein
MPQVGFELTIPVLERAKTVHGLDRAATVIGRKNYNLLIIIRLINPSMIAVARSNRETWD